MTNTLHIERTNTFNWNPQAPVARKPSKREEVQDDDNHCHSPGRPWFQSLPARRRKLKWLPHFFFFVFVAMITLNKIFLHICHDKKVDLLWIIMNLLLVRRQPAEGGHLQDHQHPPRAPEDQVWGQVTHKIILSSMYIARGQHPCLAWQGTVLYEDGAKISEVGIKDGCSIHLAIYSTDQVCVMMKHMTVVCCLCDPGELQGDLDESSHHQLEELQQCSIWPTSLQLDRCYLNKLPNQWRVLIVNSFHWVKQFWSFYDTGVNAAFGISLGASSTRSPALCTDA